MKKSEVKIGQTYRAKVSGAVTDVRITGESPHGGWDAINPVTNRKVRIKSAQRLRGVARRPGKRQKIVSLAEYEAEAAPGAKPKDAKGTTKRHTGERDATGAKRASGLDAAAQVLADAGEPLNAKEMVALMLGRKLWQTNGKTPAATIYAAIIREIAVKGGGARFRKVARGKFELAK